MPKPSPLQELATEIFLQIASYLPPSSFISLVSANRAIYAAYASNSGYWRHQTLRTFHNLQHDLKNGLPGTDPSSSPGCWAWLFKSLCTRLRVYTWGDNTNGRLGHSFPELTEADTVYHWPKLSSSVSLRKATFPMLMRAPVREDELWDHSTWQRIGRGGYGGIERKRRRWVAGAGTVVDVQCGGFCTVLLNARGELWVAGKLSDQSRLGLPVTMKLRLLHFPSGWSFAASDPSTKIAQFSVGRAHVTALSEDGRVWTWVAASHESKQVKSLTSDFAVTGTEDEVGRVARVVAGWARESSAYVLGVGIVLWILPEGAPTGGRPHEEYTDTWLLHTIAVPGTAFSRRLPRDGAGKGRVDSDVGEVIKHLLLEAFIVFFTHLNRVFAVPHARLAYEDDFSSEDVVELEYLYETPPLEIRDIQGSFRRFAILTKDGRVITSDEQSIDQFLESRDRGESVPQDLKRLLPWAPNNESPPTSSVAFGDYHLLALHGDGTVSPHGRESARRGSFGLGGLPTTMFRGTTSTFAEARLHDGWMPEIPVDLTDARRLIWFEPEKHEWLQHCASEWISDNDVLYEAGEMDGWRRGFKPKQSLSWWVEQEARGWHDRADGDDRAARGDNGGKNLLPPFFVLKVAAAGWHSAALVLVDEDRAESTRRRLLLQPRGPQAAQNRRGQWTRPQEYLQINRPDDIRDPHPAWYDELDPGHDAEQVADVYEWERRPAPRPRICFPDGVVRPPDGAGPVVPWTNEPDWSLLSARAWGELDALPVDV